jgi:hypothetical protein
MTECLCGLDGDGGGGGDGGDGDGEGEGEGDGEPQTAERGTGIGRLMDSPFTLVHFSVITISVHSAKSRSKSSAVPPALKPMVFNSKFKPPSTGTERPGI